MRRLIREISQTPTGTMIGFAGYIAAILLVVLYDIRWLRWLVVGVALLVTALLIVGIAMALGLRYHQHLQIDRSRNRGEAMVRRWLAGSRPGSFSCRVARSGEVPWLP